MTTMTTTTDLIPFQTRVKIFFTRYVNPQWQGKQKGSNKILETGK